MTLKDLWHQLVDKATEEEKAIAAQFHEHIAELDATLTEVIPFKEYPKWVGNKVVSSKEEEDALQSAADPQPEPTPAPTPVAGPAAAPAVEPEPAPAAEAPPEPAAPHEEAPQ